MSVSRSLAFRCSEMDYAHFAEEICKSGIISDAWIDGEPRFLDAPLVLSPVEAAALAQAAEDICALYNEMVQRVLGSDAVEAFFGLSPVQRAMLSLGGPAWHGIARVDLFQTAHGLLTTELNSDTPTGQAEATVLSELRATSTLRDPNARLQQAFGAMVTSFVERTLPADHARVVGIIYPTEFTEDLPLVRLYRRWLTALGYDVVLGSPFNLTAGSDGSVRMFGKQVSILWRHYKTDWWGEREAAFDDEDIADRAPLLRELALIEQAEVAVVNPFSAVLPQNKRSMAYFWEHISQFSLRAQETIRKHVPPTFRLETRDHEQLLAEKDQWVLKSDYGAEGDEVIIGKLASVELFRASLQHARPRRWIVQRYFEATRRPDGMVANLGVYLCGGRACGIYGRLDQGLTDERALSVPVLIGTSQR
jgi:glutathionylspermidine synthase